MKKIFAMHSKVERFSTLADSFQTRDYGVDGMGLIYGPPGIGKTGAAIWYCDKTDAVYFRVKAHTKQKSLLKGLVRELGQTPASKIDDLYDQVCTILNEYPRLVIVDEIDYLIGSTKAIHTIRDLADETSAPFLMIGMLDTEQKLMKMAHLYDRVQAHIINLKPLASPDVKRFADQVSEVPLDDSLIEQIGRVSGGKIRKIYTEIYKAERIARVNDVKVVSLKDFKEEAQ